MSQEMLAMRNREPRIIAAICTFSITVREMACHCKGETHNQIVTQKPVSLWHGTWLVILMQLRVSSVYSTVQIEGLVRWFLCRGHDPFIGLWENRERVPPGPPRLRQSGLLGNSCLLTMTLNQIANRSYVFHPNRKEVRLSSFIFLTSFYVTALASKC